MARSLLALFTAMAALASCTEFRERACAPGELACDGDGNVVLCKEGGGYEKVKGCPAGTGCAAGECVPVGPQPPVSDVVAVPDTTVAPDTHDVGDGPAHWDSPGWPDVVQPDTQHWDTAKQDLPGPGPDTAVWPDTPHADTLPDTAPQEAGQACDPPCPEQAPLCLGYGVCTVAGEFTVNDQTEGQQWFAVAAVSAEPGEQFAVFWSGAGQAADTGLEIQGRLFNQSGAPAGGDMPVNVDSSGDQVRAAAAMLPGDVIVIAWQSMPQGGDATVRARVMSGSPSNEFAPAGEGPSRFPAAVAMPPDSFAMAWQAGAAGAGEALARKFTVVAGGLPEPAGESVPIDENADTGESNPSLCRTSAGGVAAAALSGPAGHPGTDVVVRLFSGDLEPISPALSFGAGPGSSGPVAPSLAPLDSGGVLVAFDAPTGQGSERAVLLNAVGPDGVSSGEPVKVAVTSDDIGAPAVCTGAEGEALVAWHQDKGDTGRDILARRFDSDLIPDGDVFTVNKVTAGSQGYPRLAAFPDGRLLVLWHTDTVSGGEASLNEVRGRFLEF